MRIVIIMTMFLSSCSDDDTIQDTGTDTGSDTDTDTDSDTDSDSDTEDAGPSCVLEYEPEMPLSNCEVEWAYVYEDLPGVISGRAEAIVELSKGGFAVFGDSGTLKPLDSEDTSDGMVMMLDENGVMTDFRSFPGKGWGYFTRAHATDLGSLAIGCQYADLWTVMLGDDGTEVYNQGFLDTTGISDSYFDGVDTVVTTSARYLGFLDIDGSSHQKTYTTEYPLNSYGIAPAGDSATAVVGWIWMDVPLDHFDNDYEESFFMLFDPTMEKAKHRVVCPGFDTKLLRVVPGHEGGFLAGGGVELEEDPWPKTFMVKMSEEGSIEWSRYFGLNYSTGVSRILTLDDGYIYTASSYASPGTGYGYVAKVDVDGKLLWHLSPFSETGAFLDIIVTTDGDYIIVGLANTTNGQWPCVVKIRSAGECI